MFSFFFAEGIDFFFLFAVVLDVMQVAHHYFENGIAYFTKRINRCISICVLSLLSYFISIIDRPLSLCQWRSCSFHGSQCV